MILISRLSSSHRVLTGVSLWAGVCPVAVREWWTSGVPSEPLLLFACNCIVRSIGLRHSFIMFARHVPQHSISKVSTIQQIWSNELRMSMIITSDWHRFGLTVSARPRQHYHWRGLALVRTPFGYPFGRTEKTKREPNVKRLDIRWMWRPTRSRHTVDAQLTQANQLPSDPYIGLKFNLCWH